MYVTCDVCFVLAAGATQSPGAARSALAAGSRACHRAGGGRRVIRCSTGTRIHVNASQLVVA